MTQPRRFGVDNSPFATWVRGNRELDSVAHSIVTTDIDRIFHRYRDHLDQRGSREIQHMMIVEEKTHGGGRFNAPQNDLLGFLHQLGERRGLQPGNSSIRCGRKPPKLFSVANGKMVQVKFYGVFYLVFEKTSPVDSEWMRWGPIMKGEPKQTIDTAQLVNLLRFELHPYNLTKLSDRRHHSAPALPLFTA